MSVSVCWKQNENEWKQIVGDPLKFITLVRDLKLKMVIADVASSIVCQGKAAPFITATKKKKERYNNPDFHSKNTV